MNMEKKEKEKRKKRGLLFLMEGRKMNGREKNPKIGRTPKCELFSLLLLAYSILYKQDAGQIAELTKSSIGYISSFSRFPSKDGGNNPADQCSTDNSLSIII
jgi:hypothetical protein